MRRLGIDLGTVRTGTAVSEDPLRVATPLRTINHVGFEQAVEAVAALMVSEQIGEAVLGLPLDMSGREGEAARRARRFAEALSSRTGVRVRLWDERLSTSSAERSLRTQGVRGASRRQVIDQVAATLLLQSYLDQRALPEPESA